MRPTLRILLLPCLAALFLSAGCYQHLRQVPLSPESGDTGKITDTLFTRGPNGWIQDTGMDSASLEESRSKWLALKAEYGNTYEYYQSFYSWTGFRAHYRVIVVAGSVVHAEISRSAYNYGTQIIDSLGHSTVTGDSIVYYGLKTVDYMYQFAQDSVLTKDTTENSVTFGVFGNGLLRACTYNPHNCADDCNFGYWIDSLFFGTVPVR